MQIFEIRIKNHEYIKAMIVKCATIREAKEKLARILPEAEIDFFTIKQQ